MEITRTTNTPLAIESVDRSTVKIPLDEYRDLMNIRTQFYILTDMIWENAKLSYNQKYLTIDDSEDIMNLLKVMQGLRYHEIFNSLTAGLTAINEREV